MSVSFFLFAESKQQVSYTQPSLCCNPIQTSYCKKAPNASSTISFQHGTPFFSQKGKRCKEVHLARDACKHAVLAVACTYFHLDDGVKAGGLEARIGWCSRACASERAGGGGRRWITRLTFRIIYNSGGRHWSRAHISGRRWQAGEALLAPGRYDKSIILA